LYPFGFGLSYTTFDISKISLTNKKDEITIDVKIKNTGKISGKQVVQVYVSPSQENIDKPYQSLVAFKKTPKLEPSNDIEMSLSFKLSTMARYDAKKAYYILDKGNYIIRVGDSSDNTEVFGYISLDEDIIIQQLKNINCNTDFEDYKPEVVLSDELSNLQKIELTKEDFELKKVEYDYESKTDPKIANLEDKDLAKLCIGNYIDRYGEGDLSREVGYVGLTSRSVKGIDNYLTMTDGPAGLRITKTIARDYRGYHRINDNPIIVNNYNYYKSLGKISLTQIENNEPNLSHYSNIIYQYATAIPIATALAQSFNEEFVQKCGDVVGKEMEVFNVHLWLAPAINIHRNILCGRNFEYYSEDPLVSGKMGAAMTKGVQSHKNKGTTLKHFAGNNQEFNRLNNNSKMSERALREIYLRGFQIAIEESQPHAIMTSYNLINGVHTSQNSQLLINVLRNEWKYKGLIMTDWSHSFVSEFNISKYPPQNSFDIIKAGNNIMMPGGDNDYDLLLEKLKSELLTRDDLLSCASKVYEIIELLNK
jgi:beta-glucosidase